LVLRRKAAFAVAVGVMIALQLGVTIPRVLDLHRAGGYAAFLYFQVPAILLTALGAPLLWRAAMHPRDARCGKSGAWLSLAGFVAWWCSNFPIYFRLSASFRSLRSPPERVWSAHVDAPSRRSRPAPVELHRDAAAGRRRRRRPAADAPGPSAMVAWVTMVAATLTLQGLWYLTMGGAGERLVLASSGSPPSILTLTLLIAFSMEGVTA
jgi:hypothetical protein